MTPLIANMGVPMIFVEMPGMVVALIPIIVLEAIVINRVLALSYRDSFRGVTLSNLASTFIGVPVAWCIMLVLQFAVTIPLFMVSKHHSPNSPVIAVIGYLSSIAWVPPAGAYTHWLIPAASALLLIPCFIVSLWIERRICIASWRGSDASSVRRGVFYANVASYLLLFVVACGWCAYQFFTKR
jgi:hypothetical protein